MEAYTKLLLANKAWAEEMRTRKPGFFDQLSKDQTPEFLWIGCSDSRVPAEEVTGTQPGQIFVHRNIANLVVHTDFNSTSVIQYAVEALKVKHIIVCGHTGCGGVKAALSRNSYGLLNKWLYYLKDIYVHHHEELDGLPEEERLKKMVELSVVEQIKNLSRMSVIQRAWSETGGPLLHGWVYMMNNGIIKDLVRLGPNSEIDDVFRFGDWPQPKPSF